MKKKILFVEDDPATIEVYKTALEGAGFGVETLLSGEEILERIKEIDKGKAKKPDLILLDFILPGINGLEILKEIRKRPSVKNIKVLVTTNYSIEELKAKGEFAEGERFILKASYSPREMVKLIKKEIGK